jgi:hypothetical protein
VLATLDEIKDADAPNREQAWIVARATIRTVVASLTLDLGVTVIAGVAVFAGATSLAVPIALGVIGGSLLAAFADPATEALLNWFEEETGFGFRDTMPQPTVYDSAGT